MTHLTRLPAVPSLSKLLPEGTEGGKEFSRIVGLLLLNECKRNGLEFSLFDDASGDYEGLDGFSSKFPDNTVTGFQYKFFPSPLSNQHRSLIKASLENALLRSKRLTLQKWVLVTPDDLKNSGRREGGGDVEWFQDLSDQFRDRLMVEHVGHSKLQAMFLQAHFLCLFYYPSLIPQGQVQRRNIVELRTQYDSSMLSRFGRIEFVGMPVYKEETSRRVLLDKIYIPLALLPEKSPDENDETTRICPTALLAPGSRSVILGDPGSGKSTLLAFLSLIGISEQLRLRCKFPGNDSRLTIIVVLRRYADELKRQRNLSIIDYIVEVARADFNLSDIDITFYQFYLESGHAVILFDGLDELPGPSFKLLVRQRIESFAHNNPKNTIIITSRIVGYEAEVRFDDSFEHFRLARLRLQDMAAFIEDWYSLRIDDEAEKLRNSSDLIRVLRHPDNDSIRTLARNPLLLTIVALVHRVDAILPDQRVVLYHKCTETLLNTWYRAKKRDDEVIKGRIERRNRLRIEAIAYWMHKKSISEQSRAVVQQAELHAFITSYILEVEKVKDSDDLPEDQAEYFITFIKSSAGLLIEAGDGLYSFIHLTFQEYLSATYLVAFGEIGGTQSIWDELGGDLQSPRWREVVRLLIASMKSISAQTFFVEKFLEKVELNNDRDTVLLLLGLLRDGIEPAEEKSKEIIRAAVICCAATSDSDDVRTLTSALKNWIGKDVCNFQLATSVFDVLINEYTISNGLVLALLRSSLELPQLSQEQLYRLEPTIDPAQISVLRALVACPVVSDDLQSICVNLDLIHNEWSMIRSDTNAVAALGIAVSNLLDRNSGSRRLLLRELVTLGVSWHGPNQDLSLSLSCFALAHSELHESVIRAIKGALGGRPPVNQDPQKISKGVYHSWLDAVVLSRPNLKKDDWDNFPRKSTSSRVLESFSPNFSGLRAVRHNDHDDLSEIQTIRDLFLLSMDGDPASFWNMIRSSPMFDGYLISSLESTAKLAPIAHWREALRMTLTERVPKGLEEFFSYTNWDQLAGRFEYGDEHLQCDIDFAAWLIFFDSWIWRNRGYVDKKESPIVRLLNAVEQSSNIILQFSLACRDLSQGKDDAITKLVNLVSSGDAGLIDLLDSAGWPVKNFDFLGHN